MAETSAVTAYGIVEERVKAAAKASLRGYCSLDEFLALKDGARV